MNKEIIRRWVDALRSGDFNQGQFALTEILDDSSQQHCCLGVLCSLLVEDGSIPAPTVITHDSNGEKYLAYESESGTGMPGVKATRLVYGDDYNVVSSGWNIYDPKRGRTNLTELNDNYEYTFDQIADVIEANWLQDEVDA